MFLKMTHVSKKNVENIRFVKTCFEKTCFEKTCFEKTCFEKTRGATTQVSELLWGPILNCKKKVENKKFHSEERGYFGVTKIFSGVSELFV